MGSVVLSLDAELGWGFHDLADPPTDRVESGRRGWERARSLLERYDVPATWAVVGHLLLDSCDGRHADHPAPPGWFDRERTAWRDRPDLRFGPDLVRSVRDSPVDHELASHSFSHVLFGDSATTAELARAELERCRSVGADWGLEFESFVYPRNDVGHRRALADAGFVAYRGRSPSPDGVRGVAESAVGSTRLTVEPAVDEYGLVNVPASLFCFGFEGAARTVAESVWTDPMVRQARLAIEQAATEGGVCHLWFHPNNLTSERDDARLESILETIDRRRDAGEVRVETMGDVARRVLESSAESRPRVGSS